MTTLVRSVKEKMRSTEAKVAMTTGAAFATIAPAFCDNDANSTATKIINMVFNLVSMAGLVLIIVGVVQLVRAIMAVSAGDQLQPGQIGKAIGMLVAGVVAAGLKTILAALGISTTVTITG